MSLQSIALLRSSKQQGRVPPYAQRACLQSTFSVSRSLRDAGCGGALWLLKFYVCANSLDAPPSKRSFHAGTGWTIISKGEQVWPNMIS